MIQHLVSLGFNLTLGFNVITMTIIIIVLMDHYFILYKKISNKLRKVPPHLLK